MKYSKCSNHPYYWMIRVSGFDKTKRDVLTNIAKKNRQSVGAFVGNLLDKEIRKAEAREEKA